MEWNSGSFGIEVFWNEYQEMWEAMSYRDGMLLHLSRHHTKGEAIDMIMENTIFASDMQRRKCEEILSL